VHPRENPGYAYAIIVSKSWYQHLVSYHIVSYRISRVNVRTCPVFLKHLEGRFPTAYIEICGCVTTGIPFAIVMWKSDIEVSLVMIRKLVTWLVLLWRQWSCICQSRAWYWCCRVKVCIWITGDRFVRPTIARCQCAAMFKNGKNREPHKRELYPVVPKCLGSEVSDHSQYGVPENRTSPHITSLWA